MLLGRYRRRLFSHSLVSVQSHLLTPGNQKATRRILEHNIGIFPATADQQWEFDCSPAGRTAHTRWQGFEDSCCGLRCRVQPFVVLYWRNHDLARG